ncbi:hypothetical protein ACQVPJ_16285 [Bacillus mycoides]|uniref:hypothetical protein n=1 Tax=Bacillus mycoides TaxID=1405 RepID=UPI003D65E09F
MKNIIEVTNLDKVMANIDELVEKYQETLTSITEEETNVDSFSIGNIYLVYLRSGNMSKSISFDLNGLTEENFN